MKTRTLVMIAGVVGLLMALQWLPRGDATRALVPEALAQDMDTDSVAEAEAAALGQPDAVEPAPPAPAEPVAEPEPEPDPEPPADVIRLAPQRELSAGIDVSGGEDEGDLISITLDDVPLQDVVRMFTRISGANIVAGTNMQGRVTVSLQDVEWEPAFRVILDSADMVLVEKTDGIYTIMSKNALSAEPVTVDTIFLKFSTVSNVLPVVNRMLVSTNASAAAFPSANALVVQETADRLNTIRSVIDQIDIPRPQVYIEAKFVELNDEAITDLGIDWSALGSDESGLGYTLGANSLKRDFTETRRLYRQDAMADFDTDRFTEVGTRDILPGTTPATRSQGDVLTRNDIALGGKNFTSVDVKEDGGATIETIVPLERLEILTSVLTAEDFQLTLSALNQNSGVDIVSNPKVIVANEETATIHVGRNEPNVVAVPQGDTGDRFAFTLDTRNPFIEIGVKLEVTPTVNTEDNITVQLQPELSRLIGQKEVGEGSTRITFPITQIRKVRTEFNLQSGNTVAIGGLTENQDVESVKKIPILGDIPLLGKYLFRHTHTENVQDEVIIFVTVGLANPESLVEVAGVPSEGKLIHDFMARRAAIAAKAK